MEKEHKILEKEHKLLEKEHSVMEEEHKIIAAQETQSQTANNFGVPFAIIVAGLAIAAAIYSGDGKKMVEPAVGGQKVVVGGQGLPVVNLNPITSSDYIIGNPSAKVIIVEYSDFECRFCKIFHPTMHKIMDEYREGGNVAWVYRHFASGLFSKSQKQAEASECAAKQGGNTKFWEYTNKIFEITPSSNGLDMTLLPVIAKDLGLNVIEFEKCLSSGEMTAIVEASTAGGVKAGVAGTPHSLILVNKKVVGAIGGAQPYEAVKAQIENALK